MAKFFSISLSFLILFQSFNLDLTDLAHIDELIEHAQFHSEKYGDNFFVFISKHYGEMEKEHKAEHQEEKDEHEELPFNHHCCSHIFTAFVHNKTQLPEHKTVPVADYTANFFYIDNYNSLEKTDIFQPPKNS
ncbi:hypothetical protein [Maribacter sp. HTCC2170]|uniref:hypothetical protein n=1 Tax=Maribacter sp. (strain HTCC2170 / KCCM 42371) TaxID=313603 RepID=UPI00006AFCD2|nr:hypothetical protein [Maribacter sp. HTCC2170]EAR01170.1 hypothetical protein FB2170_10636 [Maribacter sp. HTCC2170]